MNNSSGTKIVIGNGFDLACGYKTSYKDFFTSPYFLLGNIESFMDYVSSTLLGTPKNLSSILALKINVWSLLFYLSSNDLELNTLKPKTLNTQIKPDIKWCDIEEIMSLSFQKEISSSSIGLPVPIWSKVFESDNGEGLYRIEIPLATFFKKYHPDVNVSKLYLFLYDQLTDFEKVFGKFIDGQTKVDNRRKAFELINTINFMHTDAISDSSIDSFNFSNVVSSTYHINGDTSNPIFGIDSKDIKKDNPSYHFTKTYQRIGQLEKTKRNMTSFNNLIVYGHSLNQQDYSYFLPIFDALDFYNRNSKSSITFGYSYYKLENKTIDESKIIEKNKLSSGIAELFAAYEDYNPKYTDKRLLDSLMLQGRVKTINADDSDEISDALSSKF